MLGILQVTNEDIHVCRGIPCLLASKKVLYKLFLLLLCEGFSLKLKVT